MLNCKIKVNLGFYVLLEDWVETCIGKKKKGKKEWWKKKGKRG